MATAVNPKTQIEDDEIDTDTSCWRDVFKTRDTRKMGNAARCLTLFHNLTILIALFLTLFQHYEAASISLVASMVALYIAQQEEDGKIDNDDLCAAEIQQTNRPSAPRRKKRKTRKTKTRRKSDLDSKEGTTESATPQPRMPAPVVSEPPTESKEPALPKATVLSEAASPEAPTLSEEPPVEAEAFGIVNGFLGEEDALTDTFDDVVAKFRARLETIQSSADRPKINITAGVFAKQLAAKKSVARSRSGGLVSA